MRLLSLLAAAGVAGSALAASQDVVRTAVITRRGLKPTDFPRITKLANTCSEGRRLHDAGVPVESAAGRADFGSYADWTRRAENAAGALKRVYMELDGELKP